MGSLKRNEKLSTGWNKYRCCIDNHLKLIKLTLFYATDGFFLSNHKIRGFNLLVAALVITLSDC